jgi:hypothetical protein
MLFRFWVFPDCTFLDISTISQGGTSQSQSNIIGIPIPGADPTPFASLQRVVAAVSD